MKKIKLMVSVFTIITLLCACSKDETTNSVKQGLAEERSFYVSSQIYWEDYANAIKINQCAERLVWAGYDGRAYARDVHDFNATDITPELEYDQQVTCAAPGVADETVFVVTEYDDNGEIDNEILMVRSSDNSVTEQSISEKGVINPTMLVVDDIGNIALGMDNGTVYVFSPDLEVVIQSSFSQLIDLAICSGEIYVFAVNEMGKKMILNFDYGQNKFMEKTSVSEEVSRIHGISDGTILLESDQGVFDIDGSQLFTWSELGLAHGQMLYLFSMSSREFFYYAVSSDSFVLISDKQPVQNEDTVTIKLACWMESLPLTRAVTDFNLSQNEYCVEIVDYYTDDIDPYQGMERMNAALLSGETPDLYALNSMNAAALQRAGLLLDLCPIINTDPYFSRDDYLSQCWELYMEDGHQYQLAPAFVICGVMGPESILEGHRNWNMAEYQECLETDKNQFQMYCNNETVMMDHCIRYTLGSIVDVKKGICDFETKAFYDVLSLCKSYGENNMNDGVLVPGWIESVSEYALWKDEFGGTVGIAGFPNENRSGPVWDAMETFAISSESSNQEGAWKFLKFLLQEYAQMNIWGFDYFPVNKVALDYVLAGAKYPGNDSRSTLAANRENALTENDIIVIQTTISELDDIAFRDDNIWGIIREEVPAYYCGDKTEEEVAKLIQNRVSIYLAEQK